MDNSFLPSNGYGLPQNGACPNNILAGATTMRPVAYFLNGGSEMVEKFVYDQAIAQNWELATNLHSALNYIAEQEAKAQNKEYQKIQSAEIHERAKYRISNFGEDEAKRPIVWRVNSYGKYLDYLISPCSYFTVQNVHNLDDDTTGTRVSFFDIHGKPCCFWVPEGKFTRSVVCNLFLESGGFLSAEGTKGKEWLFQYLCKCRDASEKLLEYTGWNKSNGSWSYHAASDDLLKRPVLDKSTLSNHGRMIEDLVFLYAVLLERLPIRVRIKKRFVFLTQKDSEERLNLCDVPKKFRETLYTKHPTPLNMILLPQKVNHYCVKQNMEVFSNYVGSKGERSMYVLVAEKLSLIVDGCLPVEIPDFPSADEPFVNLTLGKFVDLIEYNPAAFEDTFFKAYYTCPLSVDVEHPARSTLRTLYAIAAVLNWACNMVTKLDKDTVLQCASECLEKYAKYWDTVCQDEVTERFAEALRIAVENGKLQVFPKTQVPMKYDSRNSILTDESYIYISSALLEKIIGACMRDHLVKSVVALLEEAGTLGKPIKEYFTLSSGQHCEPRLRKLPRSFLYKDLHSGGVAKSRVPVRQIGRTIHGEAVYSSDAAPNQHCLVTGASGSGKSCALFTMEKYAAGNGNVAVVIDYCNSHKKETMDSFFADAPELQRVYFNVQESGLPFNLWPEKNDPAAELTEIGEHIATALGMTGKNQNDTVINLYKDAFYQYGDTTYDCFEAMRRTLSSWPGNSENQKLKNALDAFRFERSGCTDLCAQGRILVVDLSGFDQKIAISLAELILAHLFRCRRKKKEQGMQLEPYVLFLDEVQKLPAGVRAVLPMLIREGRKYEISAVCATQYLDKNRMNGELLELFGQMSFKLAFQQEGSAADLLAREVSAFRTVKNHLVGLEKGQCFATGKFLVEGKSTDGLILLDYR